MSVIITIQGTSIAFPSSGEPENWSQPLIDFATAVQDALSSITGPADVPPQTLTIDAFNPGSNIVIPALTFSTTTVRGAFIRYAVNRTTSLTSVSEIGEIEIVYNATGPTGNKWEYGRTYTGDASITFTITDVGQVLLNTTSLSGINHTGILTYTAQALLQTS